MKNKNKMKYDKGRARLYFVTLKIIEVLALLAFIFLPYVLGLWYNFLIRSKTPFVFVDNQFTSVIAIWAAGWIFLFNFLFVLICIVFILGLAYIIIKAYFKMNWNWAKSLAEDPVEREKRIAKEKTSNRKKHGFAIGDEVIIKKNLVNGKEYGNKVKFIRYMKEYLGKKTTIRDIDEDGDFRLNIDKGEYCWAKEMLNKPKDDKIKKQSK